MEVSNSKEAEGFDWSSWRDLMIFALIVPKTVDALVDYWKANTNMLDWSKKIKPDIYEEIRTKFAERKKQILKGEKSARIR